MWTSLQFVGEEAGEKPNLSAACQRSFMYLMSHTLRKRNRQEKVKSDVFSSMALKTVCFSGYSEYTSGPTSTIFFFLFYKLPRIGFTAAISVAVPQKQLQSETSLLFSTPHRLGQSAPVAPPTQLCRRGRRPCPLVEAEARTRAQQR